MRPVASAGKRARTRAFSNSISLGLIEAIVGWALDADTLIVQKSSKPANALSTGISRVSTASRPARVHNSRSTSIRDASRRGGFRTVSPIALISIRKRHSISATELGDACCRSGARKGKLALGWINSLDLDWRAAFHEQLGESAIAATNVDPFQIRCGCQPIKKDATRSSTPIPHHPLIRGPVLEADLSFTHQCASFRDFTGKSGKVKTHWQSWRPTVSFYTPYGLRDVCFRE